MHDAVMRDVVRNKHLTNRRSLKSYVAILSLHEMEVMVDGWKLLNFSHTAQQRTEVSTCAS